MRIENATLADGRAVDVRIEDRTVETVGDLDSVDAEETVDTEESLLLPGTIDVHVHFHEPGFEHKETWEAGARGATAGGVTTVADQPNTDPTTTGGAGFDVKTECAVNACIDYGINGGVIADWGPDSLFGRSLFVLGKVFLADSTGDMGIEADLFAEAAERTGETGVSATVHAEDTDLFDESVIEGDLGGVGRDADADAWSTYRTVGAEAVAVERAVRVGGEAGAQIHIAHMSTPEDVDAARDSGVICEAMPHHLFLSRDDLDELGAYGRMNPPLRSEARREAIFERLADGHIDMVVTDHAPHTREEKERSLLDAPSGVPGVETMVPLLLGAAVAGDLIAERVRGVVAANPTDVFGLPRKGRIEAGADADLALYDLDATREIHGADLHSNCEWMPFEGHIGVFPEWTMLRDEFVWDGGELGAVAGENVRD